MKLRAVLAGLFLCASAVLLYAGDYKTLVLSANGSENINVASDGFILLRNFTQEDGATRGTVNLTTDSGSVSVLAASIIDPDAASDLETVNSIIIAGPATLTVSCPSDATNCVLTFRKTSGSN